MLVNLLNLALQDEEKANDGDDCDSLHLSSSDALTAVVANL